MQRGDCWRADWRSSLSTRRRRATPCRKRASLTKMSVFPLTKFPYRTSQYRMPSKIWHVLDPCARIHRRRVRLTDVFTSSTHLLGRVQVLRSRVSHFIEDSVRAGLETMGMLMCLVWKHTVCVCVFFPSILDIKFVGRTGRGHTGGRSHRIFNPPSSCGACLDFCREKDSAIPFPRRP